MISGFCKVAIEIFGHREKNRKIHRKIHIPGKYTVRNKWTEERSGQARRVYLPEARRVLACEQAKSDRGNINALKKISDIKLLEIMQKYRNLE